MKPDRNVARVHRFLQAKTSPQAVVRDRLGRLELVDADSARFSAITRSSEWSQRVLGVFSPTISLAAFEREAGRCS